MDKIIVKNLLMRGILGFNPEERIKKQDILVSYTLFTNITHAGETDDVANTTNYKTITKKIIKRVEQGTDNLVEKLVLDLARMILTDAPEVERVIISVEKPTALRFAESVGIEIERSRKDFNLS